MNSTITPAYTIRKIQPTDSGKDSVIAVVDEFVDKTVGADDMDDNIGAAAPNGQTWLLEQGKQDFCPGVAATVCDAQG